MDHDEGTVRESCSGTAFGGLSQSQLATAIEGSLCPLHYHSERDAQAGRDLSDGDKRLELDAALRLLVHNCSSAIPDRPQTARILSPE
jgi:hypothetical protein